MDDVILRDLDIGDAGWLIERHAVLYHREEGFDASFEALVAEVLADFMRNRDPDRERAWIAERHGTRLGSIFLTQGDAPHVAKLRLFLLVPEARGLGLGRRLLEAFLDGARHRGYTAVRLSTHASHEAACALYRKSGFEMTGETAVVSFGVPLVEQTWERVL